MPPLFVSNADSLWLLQKLSSVECSAGQSGHPYYIPVPPKSPPPPKYYSVIAPFLRKLYEAEDRLARTSAPAPTPPHQTPLMRLVDGMDDALARAFLQDYFAAASRGVAEPSSPAASPTSSPPPCPTSPDVDSDDKVLEFAAALDFLDDGPLGLHAFMNTIVLSFTAEPASTAGPGVVAQSATPSHQGKQRILHMSRGSNSYGHPFHMTIAAAPY